MGERARKYSLVLLGLLAVAHGWIVIAADPLGSTTISHTEPGLNVITRQYDSCATTLVEAFHVLNLPTPLADGEAPEAGPWVTLVFQSGQKKCDIQCQSYPENEIHGLQLVHVPEQSFLVGSTDTPHKSINSKVSFSGFYLLYPVATEIQGQQTSVNRFLGQHFAQISLEETGESVVLAGKYYLVPVEQYPLLFQVLMGTEGSSWQYDVGLSVPPPSPPIFPATPSPKVLTTHRGTIYRFEPSGRVTVFTRRGETLRYDPPHPNGASKASFSSHAAILRRQGVVAPTSARTPLDLLTVGLKNNARTIGDFHQGHPHLTQPWNVYSYQMALQRDAYLAAGDSESGRAIQQRALEEALRLADSAFELLPEHLRWRRPNDKSLFEAPVNTIEDKAMRVVRRFLFIRSLTNQKPTVRILTDSMHLQALHAYMGDFFERLQADDLISGGELAYTYDPRTHEITSISLEGNGIVTPSHASSLMKLSSIEVALLGNEMHSALPFTLRSTVQISIADGDGTQ